MMRLFVLLLIVINLSLFYLNIMDSYYFQAAFNCLVVLGISVGYYLITKMIARHKAMAEGFIVTTIKNYTSKM